MTNKLEDKFVKSLGVLDEESKKIIWNTCISGSQIKKMFYNIRDLYNEKRTVGVEKVFSEKAEEKMKMGRLIEPFIRETASKEFGLEKVLVTCRENNIGSKKTMEKFNGKADTLVPSIHDGIMEYRYWINIKD